jgi:hypothetical protein
MKPVTNPARSTQKSHVCLFLGRHRWHGAAMSTATDMLAKYLAAEGAILSGQSVRWGDRTLQRADLPEVRAGRREWETRVQAEQNSAATTPSIGGLSYSVARLDRDA